MGSLRREEDFLDDGGHNARVLLVTSQVHREDIFLHFFCRHVEQLHCVRLVRMGRPIPLDRLRRFLILFASRCLGRPLLFLLVIVVTWVELSKGDLDVFPSLLVKLVRRRVELLHLRLARDHGQKVL